MFQNNCEHVEEKKHSIEYIPLKYGQGVVNADGIAPPFHLGTTGSLKSRPRSIISLGAC